MDSVAGESDTANNCSASVRVTVSAVEPPPPPPQTHPDLVVESPSVSDGSPAAGASFTLSATVRNAGDGASAGTTLRYYRSTDATITTSDTAAGTDPVGGLAASGSSSQSVDVTAPSSSGTYYYGACVDAVTGESDTTNNCSGSVQVTVSAPPPPPPPPTSPDLVVGSPSVTDSSLDTGDSFTLSATVENAGDGASAATTLRYYRSTDGTITSSDAEVGTDAVGGLSAGASSPESIGLTAPSTAATYYYGACVDSVTGESDTTNNCSDSVQVTVLAPPPPPPPPPTSPDLVVGSPSVTDSSLDTGDSFTLSATVENAGDGASAATTLRYYRSTDAAITSSDAEVGTDAVGGLSAGASSSESIGLTAPSTAATYYYGACVDAVTGESDTTNNCSGSVQVTVLAPPPPPTSPDLTVGSPSVTDSSLETGDSFTLSATVENAGDGASAATTLRYYRSTDAAITTSDTEVGTDAVGGLSAGGSSGESIGLTAPSTAATYYYGACVDSVTGESDTTNNCSGSVQVTVSAPPPPPPPPPTNPDLVVGSPSVTDSSLETGDSFTLSATVENAGDGASAATTLRYYRSTDAAVTTSDTEVGTDAVGGLSAGGSSGESIGLTAPSTAATYYYGACVDSVTGESDTTNNCSGSVQVTVSAPPPPTNPDLVVGSPSVTDSSLETGDSFTLSATVENAGDGASAATTLRYYRSTDAAITTSDTEVGTDAVGGLSAGGSSGESIGLTAPSTAATYYYGACVDSVTGESDTTNNCSGSVQVTVTAPPPPTNPDLVVGSPSVTDSSLETGDSFTLSATVENAGDGASAATTLRYYRSTDAAVTTSDTEVGTDAVGGLSAGGSSSESIGLTAPSTAATYYYGACVDSVTGESDTTNNCSGSVQVTVTVPEEGEPDLEIRSIGTFISGVGNTYPGESFQIAASVRNDGDGPAEATTLRIYRSSDTTVDTSDTQVGTAAVAGLAASEGASATIRVTSPLSPGTYYYGACVDAVTGESDTTNNCGGPLEVPVVPRGQPDLVVEPPTLAPPFPSGGATFTLTATVWNFAQVVEGTSEATTLRYYLSTDSAISTSDTQVGTDAVPALGSRGRSTQSVELTAPSTPGTYHYGACVDAVSDESDTTNNCSRSRDVVVREP